MHQVLFEIPIFGGIPVYGFGAALCVAFLVCPWLATKLARMEGIHPDRIWDLAFVLFFTGILGGRILYMITEPAPGQKWYDIIKIWQGGLILYGAIGGAAIGYILAYYLIIRRHGISTLKLVDIIAPSIALGLLFGRIGCFMSGCCYGDVADPARVSWGLRFPTNSPAHRAMVKRGYQTAYSFLLAGESPTVQVVEPGSSAAEAGLKPGDRIVMVGGVKTASRLDVEMALQAWPSEHPMQLTVARGDPPKTIDMEFQPPGSLPVHPTQLYSSLDGLFQFLLLMAVYPFRRRPGQVLALFMVTYAVTRFLIESLRSDNPATLTGLTISQNLSIVLFVGGIIFFLWLRTQPRLAATQRGAGAEAHAPKS